MRDTVSLSVAPVCHYTQLFRVCCEAHPVLHRPIQACFTAFTGAMSTAYNTSNICGIVYSIFSATDLFICGRFSLHCFLRFLSTKHTAAVTVTLLYILTQCSGSTCSFKCGMYSMCPAGCRRISTSLRCHRE